MSRADFRYDERIEGREARFVSRSTPAGDDRNPLVPELAAHAGVTFDELVRWMVEDASLNR